MVVLRFVGTRPLTERDIDRFDRPPTPPCDGSYTDPWECAEALHGPLYGSNPDYSFAEHCDEMGLPSGERNAYLQRLEDRHAKAERIAEEVAKADARVKAWDESVARVQEMCRKFKPIEPKC